MAAKKNFPLRIDPELHAALERWAAEEFRSVNGHIEYLLRESLKRAGRLPGRAASEDE
ncbi:toxin-antitoxin system HicB family antitoxin [Paenibacillus spiritus]|uniref:Toxin-antitoxin system HicB family antitoxin n=1 Tax=Paenibacillus spiritus TaxID=2496557 RepID=A0A5J5FZ91_9BACL|nr:MULTISPECIES: toxin-antitoxin system HicB family antitoxin [Paenibacillus]KAA8999632.1 toxin-antitoxin system HicB family antitoxin [Paenibacillus spiritus]